MDAAPAAFPTLTEDQIGRLREAGRERDVDCGEILFREGDPGYDFFVVLRGEVMVYEDLECRRPLAARPVRAGQILGEMGLLLGESVYATARVDAAGRVLQVPRERFRELMGSDTGLAEVVLRAFAARRGLVAEGASGLTLVGARTDPDAVRLAEFARRNYLPVRWLEPDDDEAREALARAEASGSEPPVVVWGTETVLERPTNLQLARAVGIGDDPPEAETFDLLVIGAGPAGLGAAVYGASEGLATLVLDEVGPGGQAGASSRIENYLGFPAGLSGTELATRATVQARKFGACFATPRRALALRHAEGAPPGAADRQAADHPASGEDGSEPGAPPVHGGETAPEDGAPGEPAPRQRPYAVEIDHGPPLRARAVVIATGAHYRRLPLDGLRRYEGAGVYYAATEMEAQACAGATAVVVGGGNSAGQAAMFLSERAARVLLLLRGGDLGKSMSRYLADRVEASDAVEVRLHTEATALGGGDALEWVELTGEDGEAERVETPSLFVFIGADPCTDWLSAEASGDGPPEPDGPLGLALDRHGFIRTGADIPPEALRAALWGRRRPGPFETSLPGVFAVGDVRSGSTKRVAGAVGEGAVTVKAVHGWLAAQREAPED